MDHPGFLIRRLFALLVLITRGASGQGASTDDGNRQEAADAPTRYTLDAIVITGNTDTKSRIIRRYVPFKPGTILDVDDPRLRLTQYRLLGTGFFRDVTLSLSKGEIRDHVVLNINVVERNSVVLSDLWMGLSASAESNGSEPAQFLSPFAGLEAAETNLLGTGISLSAATAFSERQGALALRFLNPAPASGGWMWSGQFLFNQGLGFFGNSRVRWDNPRTVDTVPRQAVVDYQRLGGAAGLGIDLSVSTQAWFNYRLETTSASPPEAAAHEYGGTLEPIDFHIHRGRSILTSLSGSLHHDTRDTPFLTTQGIQATAKAEASLAPLGSDYAYQRLELDAAKWVALTRGQVLRLSAFAGAIAGYAPFYERYHISDLSDFRPGRILGLAFDDRPAPNFLGTSIAEIRYGDFAARFDAQYRFPLYRGYRSIYGIDLFVSGGLIALAGKRDIVRPPRNRSGFELVPIDLTANFGLQLDTSLGGMTFTLANVLGFVPTGRRQP